jgi:hypothetical protein
LGHYLEGRGSGDGRDQPDPAADRKHSAAAGTLGTVQLGRPFGPPSDPAFQKRVIIAALRLVQREDGPVVIEDFPDDDRRAQPDPGWRPPFDHAVVADGPAETIARELESEIELLPRAHDRWVTQHGYTAPWGRAGSRWPTAAAWWPGSSAARP